MAQTIDAAFARGFLARLHAAVNAHDAAAVAALCCEDVIRDDPAAPGPQRGREAVRPAGAAGVCADEPPTTAE